MCDGRDERAHDYRFESRLGSVPLWGTATSDTYTLPNAPEETVIDAGRVILGEESFEVRAESGRDLVVVLRTTPTAAAGVRRASGNSVTTLELGSARFTLDVNETRTLQASVPLHSGWNELVARVPGSAIRTNRPRLRFRGRYASFYFWFFQ